MVCLQEVDVAQPRSHDTHQVQVAARSLGTTQWRFAPTVAGTPSPWRSWHRLSPADAAFGPDSAPVSVRPLFGNAVLSRLPVRRWEVLPLGHGRARLPLHLPGPDGVARWWWIPDEPRVAVAAVLDGCTVVGTHLSFSPATSPVQLRRLRRWAATLPGPVLVAGDLNLPGALPARLLGGRRLVTADTYPAPAPRLQLDHVVGPPGSRAEDVVVRALAVGDHRAVAATVAW